MYLSYRFSEFRLDPASRELWRGDAEVSLPPKAFGCLVYLIEHRDRAVGRDELIEAVWGKENLDDSVLGRAILLVRRALDDSGDEPRHVKTLRGFGYRWAAPVEVEEGPSEAVDTAPGPAAAGRRALPWALALLAIAALAAFAIPRFRGGTTAVPGGVPSETEGRIAAVLPVTVDDDGGERAWIRFGVMDLIAQRLRAAGQPTVPSGSVIALLHDVPDPRGEDRLDRLIAATGARLVLAARVETAGARWRVSLHSLHGGDPPLSSVGEAYDVLTAARRAADRMARALGFTPVAEANADPDLTRLLQRVQAARLAQRQDDARALIEAADPRLRRHPDVRFQRAGVELDGHRLDAAQAAYESLLRETPAKRDPVLRARILHGLSGVHFQRATYEDAERLLSEAVDLLVENGAEGDFGNALTTLGLLRLMRGDFAGAEVLYARARRALESTGDAVGLATLDNNLGLLEALRERYAEALTHFERAAERDEALRNVGAELRNRANAIEAHLGLLDPRAASEVESRLEQLLRQTNNPEIAAHANLTKAYLLAARGRQRDAERTLTGVLNATAARDDLELPRRRALVLGAEWAVDAGDFARAASWAREAVEGLPEDSLLVAEERGRASLSLVRALVALGEREAAATVATTLSAWAEGKPARSVRAYAALARAEVAYVGGERDAAETAFREALALADASRLPALRLRVADAYVAWLLDDPAARIERRERALVVASDLAGHAEQDYGAALLQLRVYHAVGPPSAWRLALARARSLAGERRVPRGLLTPPESLLAPKAP